MLDDLLPAVKKSGTPSENPEDIFSREESGFGSSIQSKKKAGSRKILHLKKEKDLYEKKRGPCRIRVFSIQAIGMILVSYNKHLHSSLERDTEMF